jgi:hypothetical protein
MLCWKFNCTCIHLQLSDLKVNISVKYLNFNEDFEMVFQHAWNTKCNHSSLILPKFILIIVHNVYNNQQFKINQILSFRKPGTFNVHGFHVVQKIYYSATFQLQFVQYTVRFYNWWNLQSSPRVTPLTLILLM